MSDILKTRMTRKTYLPFYSLFTLTLLGSMYLTFTGTLSFGVFAASILAIIIGIKATEIHRLGHSYEVNPLSVVHTKGYFATHSRRIDLFAISDIIVRQTILQRIFNYGDVHIRMFANDTANTIKNVHDPGHFARYVEKKMSEIRGAAKTKPEEKQEPTYHETLEPHQEYKRANY